MVEEVVADLLEKVTDEWGDIMPLEVWPTDVLVDLEIICNGELQRRAG